MKEIQVHIGRRNQTVEANLTGFLLGGGSGGAVDSVNGKIGAVVLTAEDVGALPNTTKVPTKTSELTNDSGFITKAVNNLANYYLKSETYSKEELDNKISAIPKFSIEVVSSLPTANISDTTVYLVASGNEEDNLYTEYIYVNGVWEYLGKQTVDLTGYVKRTELSSYYTKSEMEELLNTVKNSIPTKLSQLTADSTHRTVTDEEKTAWNAKQPAGDYVTNEALTKKGYAKQSDLNNLSEEIVDLENNKVGKTGITLDKHTDGLIYLFVDGKPVGNGVEVTGEVVEGDIIGNFDEDNNILLSGDIADGTYKLKYQNANGEWVECGTLEVSAIVTYTITQNLTAVTSNNPTAEVRKGDSFTATLTANSGYNMSSIKVTMGGTDITSTSVSGNNVTITNVTGDVVITAVATKPNYTNLFKATEATINNRLNSSLVVTAHDGYVITNFFDMSGKVPFTADTKIYMKGATINDDGKSRIFTYKATGTTYTNSYSTINKNNCTITDEGNGVISISSIASSFTSEVKRAVMCLKVKDTALTTADLENIVITINEPI